MRKSQYSNFPIHETHNFFLFEVLSSFKRTQYYIIILPKLIRRKQTSVINQSFICKHKIYEFNTKVATHDRIVCLYSKHVCFYVFMSNKFFDFFRNMFNTKTIKVNNFKQSNVYLHLRIHQDLLGVLKNYRPQTTITDPPTGPPLTHRPLTTDHRPTGKCSTDH